MDIVFLACFEKQFKIKADWPMRKAIGRKKKREFDYQIIVDILWRSILQ